MSKTWLIKNRKGRVKGPFSEKEILEKIKVFQLSGEELISLYPAGRWKNISSHSPFYDALFEAFSPDSNKPLPGDSSSREPLFDSAEHESKETDSSFGASEDSSLGEEEKIQTKKDPAAEAKPASFKKIRLKKKSSRDTEIIEMGSAKREFSKEIKKKAPLPLFFIVILLGVVSFLFLFSKENNLDDEQLKKAEKIRLTAPRLDQPSQPKEQTLNRIKKALIYYFQDQSFLYLKAQNELVQAIEGDTQNKLALAYLCLVHFELWPFSLKDTPAHKVMGFVIRQSAKLDQGGIYSSLCQTVRLITKEKYNEAAGLIRTSIEEFSKNTRPENLSPFFYYLRSIVNEYQLRDDSAIQGLDYVQTLLPNWIRPYMRTAYLLRKKNDLSSALKVYSSVLKINPKHKAAALGKGVLEYQYLGKLNLSEVSIKKALHWPDLIHPRIASESYFTLAQIALKQNDKAKALLNAKSAYSYDPSNKDIQKFLENTGGDKQLKQTSVKSKLLIEKGDQMTREGKLLSAQSYYKTAYEVDGGKNAIAAKKMGQNLWNTGFLSEALEWVKKSVIADPDYTQSYVLLADYYSQMYDFDNASRVLSVARSKAPNSVDVFKGYALLQFRRNDFDGVAAYAKKSLELYEADVDSYILLSKTYGLLEKFDEALSTAKRAVEINSNSRPAQIQYARALGHIHGSQSGFDYFEKLISNSQKGSQNHIEYTLGLSQFLFESENYSQAEFTLKSLSSVDEKPHTYHLLLGQIYLASKARKEAYEQFITASSLSPSDPAPLYHIGKMFIETRQYKESRSYFKKILASHPRYPEARYYIATTLMLEGGQKNLALAVEEAKVEIQLNPNMSKAYVLIGDIYDKPGTYTLCARYFQKALEISREDSELYVRAAVCYRKAGEADLALRLLKSISEDKNEYGQTSNPKVFREMGALYEQKKDYLRATNAYALYLKMSPGAEDRKQIENRVKNFQNFQ